MSWVEKQRARIGSIAGAEIASIRAVERALADARVGGLPKFRHDQLPFVQCVFVELSLVNGRFARFSIYQNNDVFGLMLEFRADTSIEAHWNESERDGEPSSYRVAPDSDWPVGRVECVESRLDDGDISEVELVLPAHRVLLKAGEVYEGRDGTLTVSEMDEHILFFPDARDIARVTFNPRGEWIRIVGPANPKTS